MKTRFLFLAIFAVITWPAVAQSGKEAEVVKLLKLMESDRLIDGMTDNMMKMMKQQVGTQLTGTDEGVFNEYMEFLALETKAMSKQLIDVEMVGIYVRHFTEAEIRDLIAFYESPTGQKMLHELPAIQTDLMEIVMKKYLPDFQKKLQEKLERLLEK